MLLFAVACVSSAAVFKSISISNLFLKNVLSCVLGISLTLSPLFVSLWTYNPNVYNEVAMYSLLWGQLLFSLFILSLNTNKFSLILLTSFISGYYVLIRPTGIIFGMMAVLFLVYYKQGLSLLKRFFIFAIFSCGPLLTMALNWFRFGNPLEFGYKLNISGLINNEFALRHGYPYSEVKVVDALKELIGIMFFNPTLNKKFYSLGHHPWQSEVLRFREFYIETFSSKDFVIVVLMFSFIPVCSLVFRKFRFVNEEFNQKIRIYATFLASSFVMLFCFYLFSPSITSRYVADFGPTIYGSWFVFYISLVNIVSRIPIRLVKSTLNLLILITIFLQLVFHAPTLKKSLKMHYTSLDGVILNYAKFQDDLRDTVKVFPTEYQCGAIDNPRFRYNLNGWQYSSGCNVGPGTFLYLKSSRCIKVSIESNKIPNVSVYSNLVRLNLENETRVRKKYELVFCSDTEMVDIGVRQIFITWVLPSELFSNTHQIKLVKIANMTDQY